MVANELNLDRGRSNDEVFGTFAELADQLLTTYGLSVGVQAPMEQMEELKKTKANGLFKNQLDPDPNRAEFPEKPIGFEVIIPNFDSIAAPSSNKTATASDPAAGLRELLASAFPKVEIPKAENFVVRLTTVGSKTMAKASFPLGVWPEQLQGELRNNGLPVELLKPTSSNHDVVELAPEALDGQSPIRFQAGLLQFSPGSINFKPGSINFKPGSINFKPGSINFKPGSIIPEPMVEPRSELDAYLRDRWAGAMCCPSGGHQVTVAVLDTGIDSTAAKTHPLFTGNTARDPWGGSPDEELVPEGSVVDHVYGHGTHVAGIVAQRAPFAAINHEAIRADGADRTDAFEVARDLGDATEADIFVFSFSTPAQSEEEVPALRQVIDHLLGMGKVVVAAAGTQLDLQNPGDKLYPADFLPKTTQGRLISVGAVDANGIDMTTSRLDSPADNHVKSYGVGVASAFPTGRFRWGSDGPELPYNGWARWTGTSMAAPRVAGAIAHRCQTDPFCGSVVEAADAIVREARQKSNGIVS